MTSKNQLIVSVIAVSLSVVVSAVGPGPHLAVHAAVPMPYTVAGLVDAKSNSRDACLVGTWDVSDYESFMNSMSKNLSVQSVSGTQAIKYRKNGNALTVANHFTISEIAKDTHLPWTVEVTGQAFAHWSTPRKGIVKYSGVDGDFTETLSIAGKRSTFSAGSMFGNPSERYACGKYYLDIWPSPSRPPVILKRTQP